MPTTTGDYESVHEALRRAAQAGDVEMVRALRRVHALQRLANLGRLCVHPLRPQTRRQEEPSYSVAELNKMNKAALVELAQAHGQDPTGTVVALRLRLRSVMA